MSNSCALFGILKQGIIHKKLRVKIRTSKYFICILELLYKKGYIRFFSFSEDKKTIFIFLKYNYNISMIKEIIIFSKPSKRYYLPVKELRKIYRERNLFGIVSTDIGLLSLDSCLLKNKGGDLLCLID